MIRHCPNWVKDEWKSGLSVVFLSNLAIAQPHFLCGWYLRPCLVHSKSTKSDKPTISKNLKSLFRSQWTLNTLNGAVVHLEAKAPPGSRRTFSHQQKHRHTCKAPSWFTVMLHVEICTALRQQQTCDLFRLPEYQQLPKLSPGKSGG